MVRRTPRAAPCRCLEAAGELDDTLIVVTSDHGMPFPRVKGQIYEARVPPSARHPLGRDIKPRPRDRRLHQRPRLRSDILRSRDLEGPRLMTGTELSRRAEVGEVRNGRRHARYDADRQGAARPRPAHDGAIPCGRSARRSISTSATMSRTAGPRAIPRRAIATRRRTDERHSFISSFDEFYRHVLRQAARRRALSYQRIPSA